MKVKEENVARAKTAPVETDSVGTEEIPMGGKESR